MAGMSIRRPFEAAAAAAAAIVAGYIFTGALALPDRVLPSLGMVTPRRLVVLITLGGDSGRVLGWG